MVWLVSPSLESAHEFLAQELPNFALGRRSLLLVGRCQIDYQGRAQSTLETGDCVVLVKPDGTLLVHRPQGLKPVNWQPPGCTFSTRRNASNVVLEAERKKPRESVRIEFQTFELLGSVRLEQGKNLDLQGSEFDLRDALRLNPEWVEPGFVPWEPERQSERGPMDLYGEDGQGRRVIVEVKRNRAGLAEATQLWRYVEKEREKRGVAVRGLLLAPGISERARALLEEHDLEFRAFDWDLVRERNLSWEAQRQSSLVSFDLPKNKS